MREIEKDLDKRIWSHEGRERWGVKGCGLINCQSRTETTNPISADIEVKIRLMYSGDRFFKR